MRLSKALVGHVYQNAYPGARLSAWLQHLSGNPARHRIPSFFEITKKHHSLIIAGGIEHCLHNAAFGQVNLSGLRAACDADAASFVAPDGMIRSGEA